MGVFHAFFIVQMLRNPALHHIYVTSFEKIQTLCYQFYLLLKLVIRSNKILKKKKHFDEASNHFANVNYNFAHEN